MRHILERINSMRLNALNIKKTSVFIQFSMIFTWVSHLIYTDSYFSVYALCAALAVLGLWDNYQNNHTMSKLPLILNLTLASLLSLAASLANYPIFQRLRNMEEISDHTNSFLNVFEAILTFVCGIVVFYQIFLFIYSHFPIAYEDEDRLTSGKFPGRIFLGAFATYLVIYLIYLFFIVYPGNVTSDSIWQLNQIVRDAHTNHHPYWHTMSIKYSMALGYAIFHDVNAAAATYSVFQSMIMAACFAYSVVTLYQYRIPKLWVFLVYAGFAVLPCHISYSATVWKDVPFGAAVLLLVVAMFRIIRGVGNSRISNYVMFAIGGIGTGIMRTNGWYALVAAFAVLLIFFHKRCRKLLLPWFAVVLVGWILTNPVLDHLGVARVNFIEGLSVPLQQVARVIVTGGELTEEEVQKIDTILDIDKVPDAYWDKCVDEIKDLIRAKNYPYLQEHKDEYLDLWLDIGKRYPWDYVEAWVEQTKGYWNGGYDYYIYAQYVDENDFGIYLVQQDNIIHDLVKAYFTLTRETVLFEPIQSIGFNVWILSMLCFLNLIRNRKEFLLTVPVLAVIFTLWLTTPVFSEFRYAYCVFTTLPFILPVSFCKKTGEEN